MLVELFEVDAYAELTKSVEEIAKHAARETTAASRSAKMELAFTRTQSRTLRTLTPHTCWRLLNKRIVPHPLNFPARES